MHTSKAGNVKEASLLHLDWPDLDLTERVRSANRTEPLASQYVAQFQAHLHDFYAAHKRAFRWRSDPQPYYVVVSEIMLQQTQTYRVEPKFDAFIAALPDFTALAAASFSEVLSYWQGLGYNRRARFLQCLAQKVVSEYGGHLPDEVAALQELPGIGPATAASVAAFAFNKPTVFIETNIRAVFLHTFFRGIHDVPDKKILPLVSQTVDTIHPREWYYALMDYGVMLKKKFANPSRASRHHTKQSPFEGSERQIRGEILRILLKYPGITLIGMYELIKREERRIENNVAKLIDEQLIYIKNEHLYLIS